MTIVPSPRLLLLTGLVLVPLAILLAAAPALSGLFAGTAGTMAVLATLDALLGRRALDGVLATLPGLVRLTRLREASLDIRLAHGRRKAFRVRFGLALPPGLGPERDEAVIELPAGADGTDRTAARFSWNLLPNARGSYRVPRCDLEAASPLGLWAVRGSQALDTEIRVYPNLLAERTSVAALFLERAGAGRHPVRQVGKGREFEKLREYVPGDGTDEIHWKATARRGRPITKVFQIERTQEVYVVLDSSRLMARPVGREREGTPPSGPAGGSSDAVLERYVTAALVLGFAAERQGDAFGVVAFSDRVDRFLRARPGRAQFRACREALYALAPRRVTPDFEELFTFLRLRLRRRALLVFLTALDDPTLAESFTNGVRLVSGKHLVLVNTLRPRAARSVFENPDLTSLDEIYREVGGHMLLQSLDELGRGLARHGIGFSLLDDERTSAEVVTQYMRVKRRQLL